MRCEYAVLLLASVSVLVISEVIHVEREDIETVNRLLAPVPDLVVVDQRPSTHGHRVRRDVNPKHQTKHLKPPIVIDPVPSGPKVVMPGMTPREVATMVAQASQSVAARFDKLEPEIARKGARLDVNTAAWFNAASHKTKVVAKNISRVALIAEEATKFLAQTHKLTKEQVTFGLPTADVRGSVLSEQCPLEVDFPCQPRKYRAFNGYCNNVQNPRWGNANTRYLRFLPPDYSDGVSVPRQASSGEFLPSARDVSLLFHKDVDNPHQHLTAAISIWGELIYHDISHTPQMAGYQGQRLRCCNVNFNEFHPECFPIRISERDPVYSKANLRCQEYVRSGTAPRVGCTLGPREQINQVTAFLDGSSIYGSSTEESDELRTFRGGFLKMQRGPSSKGLLPADPNVIDCKVSGNQKCFKAGDVRVNEHVEITALHTVFAREHNRLAAELGRLNPHWGDETIFQEARRIIGAQMQHITYTEFLPIVLGQAIMDKYGLDPEPSGHFTGYDININAGIANSVAAAALRFFTSLMPKKLSMYKNGKKLQDKDIQSSFYAPFELYQAGVLDQILEGIARTHAQNEDEFINGVMTNHMFESTAAPGLDIAAQILQHGRDHGVPSYVKWRKFCGLPLVTRFDELRDVMSVESIKTLATVYKNVSDIDLFTGGLSEIPNKGAVVGPTFGCLIGRQFHYLRRGDRYWYENEIPPSSFTKEQLHQIKKTSLARLVCDNGDGITMIQPRMFLYADPFLNADMSCEDGVIPKMDLSPWRTASPNFVVPDNVLEDSITRARREADDIFEQELSLLGTDKVADPQSPIGTAYSFSRPKRQATLIANISRVLQFASKRFVTNILNSNQKDSETQPTNLQELMTVLPNIDVSEIVDIPRVFQCDEQTLPCDHTAKFRTMTGWCNNLQFPELGKSMRAFVRLLAPKYQDGLVEMRSKAASGRPLPSPRVISVNIHGDTSAPHVRYSLMVMQFAQFLDHDITFTPVNRGLGGTILDCEDCDSARTVHPECAPISVPQGDPWYPTIDPDTGRKKCIAFTRSLPGQLTLGYREQLNQATAFVDASNTYGSDLCDMRILRTFVGGRLNTTRHPVRGKDLLPLTSEDKECRSRTGLCFKGGDSRASEQPALTAIHTIYMREHNRVVDQLSQINPHWSDEELFQNARRIVSAGFQHVTYNEFLPRILGWNAVNLYDLKVQTEGYYEGYDSTCNPTIFNEFATAAFRFGHSLLKDHFRRMGANYADKNLVVRLRDVFMNPDVIYEAGMVDDLLRGLLATSMETLDQFITKEVTNHLFESKKHKFSGLDLASLNIQRGRDHGVRPYNEYRSLCNLKKAKTWEDLSREISPALIDKLRLTYETVDDVDLFPGGLSETPLHGGLVGPTFACIIAMQFRQLKKCDRFWYENSNPLIRFTEAQLAEIRKVSIAKVICDNADDIDQVQRSGFDMPEPFLNPRVPCKNLPGIDLDLWKERVSCTVGSMEIDIGKAERMSPCVMCTCTKEGPICQSLKIANCFQLAQSFSPESILKDHVCKVQCAFAFRAFPQVPVATDANQLGFS